MSKLTNFLRNVRVSLGSWWQLKLDLGKHQAENTFMQAPAGKGEGAGWADCVSHM